MHAKMKMNDWTDTAVGVFGRTCLNSLFKVRLTSGITGAYTPRTRHGRITPPQHARTNVRVYKRPVHSLVRYVHFLLFVEADFCD